MSAEDELARVESVASEGMRFMEARASGWSLRTKVELSIGILALLCALAFAFWPAAPIHEDTKPAPQVTQSDGSVIAERAPDPHPPKPRHAIPRGYVEERRESIHVVPDVDKKDVEIDLSLVRKGDERRVIASSPDGTVVSAIDIPIEAALIPPAPKPWAAGLSYSSTHATGVWLDRDIGRLVVGAAVERERDGRVQGSLRLGVRF